MRQAAIKVARAICTAAAILAMTGLSAALQSTVPLTAAPKAPEFAMTTAHFVLVSIPDRKLALLENGKVVRIYRVAVGKASTPARRVRSRSSTELVTRLTTTKAMLSPLVRTILWALVGWD